MRAASSITTCPSTMFTRPRTSRVIRPASAQPLANSSGFERSSSARSSPTRDSKGMLRRRKVISGSGVADVEQAVGCLDGIYLGGVDPVQDAVAHHPQHDVGQMAR
ncbi:Uncharacterised protein [Mycobacteroides abscessus subsp. abscessus]|nr:Uncharacterised protein [Mycobacteroides abscessus subsp. abscessus]